MAVESLDLHEIAKELPVGHFIGLAETGCHQALRSWPVVAWDSPVPSGSFRICGMPGTELALDIRR
jgi:hypothetical protein